MKSSIRIRLTLAEGHWTLGEHDQAIDSLRRAFEAEPDEAAVGALVDRFLEEAQESLALPALRAALEAMKKRREPEPVSVVDPGPALATSTMAELLEQQLARDGRAVRLIGLGASQLVDDAVQLSLFQGHRNGRRPARELQLEALLGSIDRLRAKYGYRCLQTGLTYFDPYVSSPDWEPYRQTGLSSQLGLEAAS